MTLGEAGRERRTVEWVDPTTARPWTLTITRETDTEGWTTYTVHAVAGGRVDGAMATTAEYRAMLVGLPHPRILMASPE
ncbi:hypothetical protein [Actinomadura kijaniata]|uniref:hypothetical protein n=1 Tax=Actinomadura kijaniata TaxID=46161 RepID=UPI00082C3D94|nr:hypothetical protein [Actinomadura kijaniata]